MVRFLLFLLIFITCYGCVDGQIADPNYDPSSFSRITGIAPRNGPLAGGTAITISGRNFTGTPTNITIGANNCLNIVFVDSSTLTCETPAGMAGVTSVVVIDPEHGRVGVGPGFNYRPVPTVTSITPDGGAVAGGTQVEINGTGFFAGVSVQIGGVDCQNTSFISSISISCSTPVGSLGSVDIDVTNIDAQSASLTGGFTYRSSPTVISITPNEGQTAGGTAVTIAGTGFLNGATIDIGGVACANVVFISAIELTCTTNMRPAGVADVTVLNPDAQTENLPTAFTYRAAPTVSSISPTGGALAGTTPLTITGTGFYAGASVDLGGSACASVTITSPTQITCTTTAHVAGAVDVQITNPDAQTGTLTGGYAYQAAPIVTNVNPTSGTVFGGTNLIITGNNFLDGAIVIINPGGGINQVACVSVVVVSVTEITCTTLLLLSTGAFVVQVENSDGQTGRTPTPLYTYVSPPIVTGIIPRSGPLAGGGILTINGTGFVMGATVDLGGNACAIVTGGLNQITCTIPAPAPANVAGSVDVVVTNPDMQTGTPTGGYTYQAAPTIASVSPSAGALAGRMALTITGTGFLTGATVNLGGNTCGSPTFNSPTEITCTTPANVAGSVDVVVTNSDMQTGTLSGGYAYQNVPTVAAVAPLSGSTVGGTDITITGTNFFLGASVSLDVVGGANCNSVNVVSPTQITCTTTAAVASNVSITVTNSDGQDGMGALYAYQTPPTITRISAPSPTAGPLAGGTAITIEGTDFITGATVDFGVSACTIVMVTSTQITCTTTAHAAGVVNVVVTNPNTQTATVFSGYTYQAAPTVASISPIGGPPVGGTFLTITGTGFLTGASVNIGTTVCGSVVVSSVIEITCTIPTIPGGTAGPAVAVTVTNPDAQTGTLTGGYTYQDAPIVASVAPSAGALAGGTPLTITGRGFLSGALIDLGGSPCSSVMVASLTQITCTTTAHAAGAVDVVVTNLDGQIGTLASAYTYQAAPTVTSISPIGGLPAGGTTLTITGTGFLTTGTTTVDLGATACGSVSVTSTTQITCTTTAHAAGVVDVEVTNPDTQTGTLTGGYNYRAAPVISTFSPSAGALAGGTSVTISGTGFLMGASIDWGGSPCSSVTVNSPTQITCTIPGGTAGPAVAVTVTNSDGQTGRFPSAYTYQAAPTITSISPIGGLPAGGTPLTIKGTGFLMGATVDIGGACTNVMVNSSTEITCDTAARVVGTVDVQITNLDRQTVTSASAYTYRAAPTVASVFPLAGALAGGTNITLAGTGFASGATVDLGGGSACSSVTVNSSTQITCTTTAHATGAVDVEITNPDTQTYISASAYTYQAAPNNLSVSPSAGAFAGGGTLTISGTDFFTTGTTTVDLGGSACGSVSVNSNIEITCTIPAGTGAATLVVTNPDGQTGILVSAYTYQGAPTITTVTPNGGPPLGTNTITITGTGFLSGASVDLGGGTCGSVVVVSTTEITCTTTAHAAGSVAITVTNPDTQTGTSTSAYTYQAAPTITSPLSPEAGALAGGTAITITGTGFLTTGTTAVDLGGSACTSVTVTPPVPPALLPTEITCTTTAHATGAVDVEITNPDTQTYISASAYTYQAAPTVSSVLPLTGPLAGGTVLTITGTGFISGASVDLGGVACGSVTVNTATEIVCTTAPRVAGNVGVIVTNNDNQSGSNAMVIFTYQDAPVISSVNPEAGALAGGTLLTITGTGFLTTGTTAVSVGGINCTGATAVSSTQINCTTGARASGRVDIIVTNPDTQTGTSTSAYTYQAAPTITSPLLSPLAGALAGGTNITLAGTGFVSGATVDLGGSACSSVTVNSPSQITCTTSAHAAGAVDIQVTNPDTQTGTLTGGYTYQMAPAISSVSPSAGALAGGTALTITGTGFFTTGTTAVSVGGINCTGATAVSSTQITCTTMFSMMAGIVDVEVTNPDTQTGTLDFSYIYQAAPGSLSISPIGGPLGGATFVTITGTGFLRGATVDIGGACTNVMVNSSTEITCTTPAHLAGAVDVEITNPDTQTGTLAGGYTYQDAPTVSSVVPLTGPLAGGTSVTITGTGFLTSGTTSVDLGGNTCSSVMVNSPTQITCTTSANSAGVVNISITNPDTQTDTLTGGYTYQVAPAISSVSPSAGALAGGTSLIITGTGFLTSGTTSVDLGGSTCAIVTVTPIQITCTPTAHLTGAVDVQITNPDTQTDTLTGGYTYQAAPAISSVFPSAGALAGGTSLTITGTGFLTSGTTSVDLGGSTCASVVVNSPTQITCTTSANSAGVVNISITNPDTQTGTLIGGYTYQVAPGISSVSPSVGALAGGTTITITGTGFLTGATVDLGGSTCAIVTGTPTQITCTTSAHLAGAVDVEVTNPDTQTDTSTSAYTYQAAPGISSVSPSAGALAGGTAITITGSGFLTAGTTSVELGGSTCNGVNVDSSTQITCTIAGGTGQATLTVTNPDGQTGTLAAAYTYQAAPAIFSISPSAGALVGGTSLAITGMGFLTSGTTSVDLGGSACSSVTVNSPTQITCTTSAHLAGTVDVEVTNADNQNSILTSAYTYQAAPVISAVSPSTGPLAGRISLTITGTGFLTSGTTRVNLGGSACGGVNVVSSTQINCTTGARASGRVDIIVTNPDNQTGTSTSAFTYQAAPVISSVSPNGGNPTGGTAITITGTGFLTSGTTSVDLGGSICSSVMVNSPTEITCTTSANSAGVVNVFITNPDTQTGSLTGGYAYQAAPTVSTVSSSTGPLAGGISLIITGTGFLSGASVDLGGVACGSVVVNSPTQITCTIPGGMGQTTLTVTNPDRQTGGLASAYTYQSAPTITSLLPVVGALAGGTSITVRGTGFLNGVTVDLGGRTCVIVTDTLTQITCTTSAHLAGTVDVEVTNLDMQTDTLTGGYTYQAAPVISSVSPSTGPLLGGTSLIITGMEFLSGASVDLGGVSCGSIVVNSLTQITCTTAANTAGVVDVSITNVDNQVGIRSGGFNYMAQATLQFAETTPDPYDYGSSNTNISYTFTLQNVGDIASSAITVAMGGTNPTVWSIGTDNCSGIGNELAPAATCTVQVTFLGSSSIGVGNYSVIVSAQATNGGTVQNQVSGEIP